jgi:hypothetical protein
MPAKGCQRPCAHWARFDVSRWRRGNHWPRAELEVGDLTSLVIHALCRYAVSTGSAVSRETLGQSFTFSTGAITQLAKDLADEIEADLDLETITARRVGRVLGKMRLRPDRTARAKGWKMTFGDLLGSLTAYGIELPE